MAHRKRVSAKGAHLKKARGKRGRKRGGKKTAVKA
jgi:hypothetical protein